MSVSSCKREETSRKQSRLRFRKSPLKNRKAVPRPVSYRQVRRACGISKEPSARGSEGFARILQPHPVAPWSQTKDSSAPSAPPYWVPEGFPRILQPHPMAPLPQTKDLSAAPCGFRNASAPPRWVLKDFQKSFNFSPITWHLCHRQKILQPHPGVGNASAPAHRHLKDLEKIL